MSDLDDKYAFPILSMISEEGVISAQIKGRYLELSGGEGGFYDITLSANEVKMLSDELLKIAEILEE